MRWNWKRWQELVKKQITNEDALKLAEVWPAFAKQQSGSRGMWAQEITYVDAPLAGWGAGTGMGRVMAAANILEKAGFASRCPGTPLYVPIDPTIEPDPPDVS